MYFEFKGPAVAIVWVDKQPPEAEHVSTETVDLGWRSCFDSVVLRMQRPAERPVGSELVC